jgi:GAF domain-containing protein
LLVKVMSARLYQQQSFEGAVATLLRDVVALHGAEFGNVQLLAGDELVIVAHLGFNPSFLRTFERVRCEDGSACGRAFNERKTIVIPDVHCDPEFEPFRLVAEAAGFRSVQTTPLFTSGGAHLIGMVSTHFAHVHQPTKIEMDTLKVYSVHAADFLEALLKGASLSAKAAEMHAKLWAQFELEALDVTKSQARYAPSSIMD